MLTPSFHFSILQQFIPIFFHHANMLLTKLSHLHMETKNGIDIVPHTIDYALQSICGKLWFLKTLYRSTLVYSTEPVVSAYLLFLYNICILILYICISLIIWRCRIVRKIRLRFYMRIQYE